MDETSIAIAVSPWATALAMYLFGIATGWLIWGGRRGAVVTSGERVKTTLGASAAGEASKPSSAGAALDALEKEISAARALLDEDDGEAAAFTEALSSLDASIKRANGRLKLLARSVRKAGER
jgi:hypothetical protein